MLIRRIGYFVLANAAFIALAMMISSPVSASPKNYFNKIRGEWSGNGSIIAGKFKDTHFSCNFKGDSLVQTGMKIGGKCRVGVFAQNMAALIQKAGNGYTGRFLDGEKGAGLDVTSGYLKGQKFVANIKRNRLRGTLVANLNDPNRMKVTISVKVEGRLVPVITMALARQGGNVIASGTD